jgi:hypothetical protein
MLRILCRFAERSRRVIQGGGTLADIHELKSRDQVVRMKSTIPNDDEAALQALYDAVDGELEQLERRFA